MNLVEIIILILIFILLYIFFLYPIILWLLSKFFRKPLKIDKTYKPPVTFIIAAYNEENYIKDAIESIFQSGYPNELIKVIVGSDGSSDNTVSIVKELQKKYQGISIYEFARSGKNSILNQIVPNADTEIILFMDADLRIEQGILEKLLSKFSDSSVACVLSSLKIINKDSNNNIGTYGEKLYQKLETRIRCHESIICSNVNSLGTLYGIRKKYFSLYPNDYVCDDLFSILSVIKSKKRVYFDLDSEVIEVREKSLKGEFERRVRLVGGGLSTIWYLKKLLLPNYGWTAFFLLSHKVSRYFSPIALLLLLFVTFFLNSKSILFKPIVYGQLFLYFTAIMGWLFERINIKFFLFRISVFFVTMNIGFLFGIFRFITRGQNARWERIDTK